MAKRRRYFQYRVTDVGGSMEGRIEVGALSFDWWHGRIHSYSIYDLELGEETGWYTVHSEGECTPKQYAALAEREKAALAEEGER